MGFGILFIGYFLFLNVIFPAYTDVLGAVIMLYGLYQLSRINRGFRLASIAAAVLTLFGLCELALEVLDAFSVLSIGDGLRSWLALGRHFLLCVTTLLALLGMQEVAGEVKLRRLEAKCRIAARATLAVYILNILMELSALGSFIPDIVLATAGVTALLMRFGVIIFNLTVIYSCYMRICMPGEKNVPERESKFGFVNAFRRHEEEKQREYAEYRLNKIKQKQGKKKK